MSRGWSAGRLFVAALASAALTAAAVFALDVPIAHACQAVSDEVVGVFRTGLGWIEVVLLIHFSKFAIGIDAVALGALLWAWRPGVGRAFVYLGLVHGLTRLVAGMLKNVFLRHRPNEVPFDPRFFQEGGVAFPSGHGAHVFGLLFVFFALDRRLGWAFTPVALFVVAARIVPNDHWLADTTGSMAIAALFAAIFWPLVKKPA
jgi:membrane-associated phospholipid phosphatase